MVLQCANFKKKFHCIKTGDEYRSIKKVSLVKKMKYCVFLEHVYPYLKSLRSQTRYQTKIIVLDMLFSDIEECLDIQNKQTKKHDNNGDKIKILVLN